MVIIKPIEINLKRISMAKSNELLTAAEVGKLWAVYMGNSMAIRVLSYFFKNTDDHEIKQVVSNALNMSKEIVEGAKVILENENYPIPIGFSEDDVNLSAPRLFADEFYLHYLKYAGKAGISIYGMAIPLVIRLDVREYFIHLQIATVMLMSQINDVLLEKGFLAKIPTIPIPDRVDFIKQKNYLNGVFGNIRPLHALEIAHLHGNIESNTTSKALLSGFIQTAQNDQVKEFFLRGKDITAKQIEESSQLLYKDDLPVPPLLDHLVSTSTISPFSDKLMLFHKIDMFAMKIRSYGNSVSISGRHDLGGIYAKFLMEIGLYVNDGAKLLIDHGWMEQIPEAADRDSLV